MTGHPQERVKVQLMAGLVLLKQKQVLHTHPHSVIVIGCCVICLSFLSLFLIIILFQERLLCYFSYIICFIISHHSSVSREAIVLLFFICFIISHHNSVSREAVVLFVIFHLFHYFSS